MSALEALNTFYRTFVKESASVTLLVRAQITKLLVNSKFSF